MPLFDLPIDRLRAYLPELGEPADLDESWARTLAAARRHEAVVEARRVETGLALVDTWDVTFAGFGGDPVRAWYSRPAGVGEALPVVVEYLGYGRGRGLPHERLTWPVAGYAHLLMDSRGQGGQYGNGGESPDPVGAAPSAPGFVTRGILDPEQHYYRRLITDGVRAVDAARALPGVDAGQVVVAGNSQGGGIALGVAGLAQGLAGVLASAPFLCHPRRALEITDQDPWGEVVRYLAVYREAEDAVLRTLSYVDGAVLGRRADAPALFAAGLRDAICPPSTVFAAFNHYGALAADRGAGAPHKTMVTYPYNGHEAGDAHQVGRALEAVASWAPSPLRGHAG